MTTFGRVHTRRALNASESKDAESMWDIEVPRAVLDEGCLPTRPRAFPHSFFRQVAALIWTRTVVMF
jgi:hypothetical protein